MTEQKRAKPDRRREIERLVHDMQRANDASAEPIASRINQYGGQLWVTWAGRLHRSVYDLLD
jgi:hypothetical protein